MRVKKRNIAVKGFARLQIVDNKTKRIVGDSGWFENQITNYGLNSCIVAAPIGAASVQAGGLRLGSGTNPASSAVALDGSHSAYYSAFAQSTVISSLTARMTQGFNGTLGAVTIANIGVFANSTGSLLAGKTYPGGSSALATTQSVNCSYEWRYTTS